MRRGIAVLVTVGAVLALTGSAAARVLRVGSYHGIGGQYLTLQAAVKAAHAGDWILVGPGDYKTKPSAVSHPKGFSKFPAGVLITKARLHIRGMNRNTVIVDGTKPGSTVCSRAGNAQNFGSRVAGKPSGLNGLMVWKAPDVSIENLTTCNFLGGSQVAGNQIWWNGGEAGRIGGYGYRGTYLSATSSYFKNEATAATYGIFSSNWSGGSWDQTYASNFNDSGYYIGACLQVCNQTMSHAHAQYNALGYSGSNAGGRMLIENSQFDHNQDGFNTNSQNGDEPSPQDGSCPGGAISPITHTHSCWVFMHNYVHDNNNPNVPSAGGAAAGPVGTGLSVSGGRNDTIMNNRFVNNDAWGAIIVNYPDTGPPCRGGTPDSPLLGKGSCLYDEWGDALINNTFTHNGSYGNPTNGQFEQLNFEPHPSNCFRGNVDTAGSLTRASAALQQIYPTCTPNAVAPNLNLPFLNEVLCDSAISVPPFGCQPGDHYPHRTRVIMHPLPDNLKTMPNPCLGVPGNPWCARLRR
ncbi:MAG: hypothetical protein WCB67_11495 [Solirubrobacteraceae bacterium]